MGDQNLKDPQKDTKNMSAQYEVEDLRSRSIRLSYTKTNKLVTALYMVTDIMDRDEPIRNKLRTLGLDVLSDAFPMSKTPFDIGKIEQIMSFLGIATAMNFISEMNCSILKKEFLELKASMQASTPTKPQWLEEFFKTSYGEELGNYATPPELAEKRENSKGHTRIGVQKGSTLMKALSRLDMSNRSPLDIKDNFDVLKKRRREEVLVIIGESPNGVTITDIKSRATGVLTSCSEKTLQRELMSMTKDGVLNKTGEKRWSKYSLGSS